MRLIAYNFRINEKREDCKNKSLNIGVDKQTLSRRYFLQFRGMARAFTLQREDVLLH
jgi:hypothetical protein